MKKLSALSAALLMIVISCFAVSAAGINAAEQSVLGNMRTPANMKGQSVYVPASYINQAEAHFNTIEMSDSQADQINGIISAGRSFLEGTGKSSVQELSSSEKQTLLSYASQAASVLQLTAVAGSDETRVKITTKAGKVIVDESNHVIKATGFSSYLSSVMVCAALTAVLLFAAAGVIIIRKRELAYE